MRISIVSAVFPPEPLTSSFTSQDIAEEMSNRGHEVMVITTFPNRPKGTLYEGFARKWLARSRQDGYEISRCWHTLSKTSSFSSRFVENISFAVSSTSALMRLPKPDVVYMNTWAVFSQNLNSLYLKSQGVPLVCSVQDIYPESLIGKKMIGKKDLIANALLNLDIAHLRRCRYITTLSASMRELIIDTRKVDPQKVIFVSNWMDEKKFDNDLPHYGEFRKKHGIAENTFVALFAGSITLSAGVGLFVKAAKLLKSKKEILILLVGDGSNREMIEGEISRNNLTNIRVIHPLTPDQVPMVQAAADILLMSLSGEMAQNAAPSKQVAYMLSGRPIIASLSPEGDPARIIRDSNAGYVLPPDNPEALADKLSELLNKKNLLLEYGINAKNYAGQNYSKSIVLPRLCDIIENSVEN